MAAFHHTTRPLRLGTAFFSVAAGAIHLAVIGTHLREYWLFGVFFVVVALFQLGWGVLLLFEQRPGWLWLAAGVNAAVLGIWILSRTVGLPLGPEAGVSQSISLADLVASGYEMVVVAGVVGLLRPKWMPHLRLSPQAAKATVLAGLVTLLPVTLLAVQSGLEHQHSHRDQAAHEDHHEH